MASLRVLPGVLQLLRGGSCALYALGDVELYFLLALVSGCLSLGVWVLLAGLGLDSSMMTSSSEALG